MKYAKSLNQFLPFILALVTTTLGIVFIIDDAFSNNGFMDLPVSACSNNQITSSDPSHLSNSSGRHNTFIDTGAKGYVSNSHHRTMGINDDDPYIHSTPLMKISFDSLVLYASNPCLLRLDVIRTIFIPPKA
jgi:hypothetical protein